ncbi:hypothetical protein TAMA11512_00500 [Selenomonas sp. TAMA-11512]|uniref:hypothetical protein n=1 Tax=Selenomonas sp. TAMA-11512 TaxID=3095337 RepID=UPI003088C6BF|nr:hypothetical protein TAMA11512_00500 [Selenomonas sp. TAMA-11512]
MQAVIKGRYQAHLDAKKRLTLRGAEYEYYEVQVYDNGVILLEPRELVRPSKLSKRTLQMMDESIRNLKAGKVSAPIDLSGL